jgi:hypothetical protein
MPRGQRSAARRRSSHDDRGSGDGLIEDCPRSGADAVLHRKLQAHDRVPDSPEKQELSVETDILAEFRMLWLGEESPLDSQVDRESSHVLRS